MRSGILVAIMAIVTILLRFLPFWVFKKNTPKYISYLGEVLPAAIIGMLVVYCLRNTDIIVAKSKKRILFFFIYSLHDHLILIIKLRQKRFHIL